MSTVAPRPEGQGEGVSSPASPSPDGGSAAGSNPIGSDVAPVPEVHVGPLTRRLLALAAVVLLYGIIAGLTWHAWVKLPTYAVQTDRSAVTSERGLTQVFDIDAKFCAVGALGGLLLGVLTWLWFRRRGWLTVPIALVATVLCALLTWWVGTAQGPSHFQQRLASAVPNDRVPIDFSLHTWTVFAVWLFAAALPVMVMSAFGRELPEHD